MISHDGTHYPDLAWALPAQPRAPESAPPICCPPAGTIAPARAIAGDWNPAAAFALLGVLLCGAAVVGLVLRLALVLGPAAPRVLVCNRLDHSSAIAPCSVSDPFIIVQHGATRAHLQIAISGDASRSGVPVTIDVRESNEAGLVTATGSTRWMLHPDGVGTAELSLQDLFAASRILLPAATAGSLGWERASYAVQVRDHATVLGETVFHVAL